MVTVVDNPKERVVQETLEAVIWPGETLLGFSVCRHNPGEFFDKVYYLGLTQRRFLLVRKDQPDRVFSIYRSYIDSVRYDEGSLIRRPSFVTCLGGDLLRLEILASWESRAVQMAEKHCTWELESPYLTAAQFLDGMSDLADLGMLRPAQVLLRKHRAEDPVLEIEPRADDLDFDLTQGRWSLWLTLIMLAIVLVYIIGRVGLGAAWAGSGILPVILLVMAGIELHRRQQTWRGLALGFSLLAAFLNLAYSGISGSLLNGLVWSAFGAASVLALTGRTSRRRNLIATAIFSLGFLAPLVITGFVVAAAPQVRFSDDFTSDKGWVTWNTETLASGIENEAYAVHVKEKNAKFFAFPPLHFTPNAVQFEARLPERYLGRVGTFGVTCGYQEDHVRQDNPILNGAGIGGANLGGAVPDGNNDDDAMYLVEIDPAGKHYSFLRQHGEESIPLGEGYWNALTGTQVRDGVIQVEVQCVDGQISLAVNGVKQGQAAVAGFAPDGKMGLFVHTWPETGPDGFKVLFDDVVFQDGSLK